MFIEATRYFSKYSRPFILMRYSLVLCLIMLMTISGCKTLGNKKGKPAVKKTPEKIIVKLVKPLPCFKLTKKSLEYINRAGVPQGVVDELEDLAGRTFKGEEKFEKAIKEKIGWLRTIQYKQMILSRVEKKKCETPKPKTKKVPKETRIKPDTKESAKKEPGRIKPKIKYDKKPVITREIGKSADSISVKMTRIGSGKDVTLIMASIRGNEKAGTFLINRLEKYLRQNINLLKGRTVLLIPKVNPDGYQNHTRGNSKGVDINRNFPGSSSPLQPETSAVINVVENYLKSKEKKRIRSKEKNRIISIRLLQSIDYDGPGRSLADRMKKYSNLRIKRWGTSRGSLGYYTGGKLGIPTITFGLHKNFAGSYNSEKLFKRYGAALMAAILYPNDPPANLIPKKVTCSDEYKKAERFFKMKNWDKTIELARDVPKADPCYYRAKRLVEKAEKNKTIPGKDPGKDGTTPGKDKSSEKRCSFEYKKAEQSLKKKKWDKTIEAVENIPEDDPCYDKAMNLIEKAKLGKKAEDIAKGTEYYINGKYIDAIVIFSKYEDDETARDYLHKSYFKTGMSLEQKDDLLNAIEAYNKSLRYNSNCSECTEHIEKCKDKYCDNHYKRGMNFYKDEKLCDAVSELESANSVCPNYNEVAEIIKIITDLLKKKGEDC
ncbi:MAG: murein peptide amidase A [Desulfobacterales bacterium]|nr:murein peptide amidase A [Desulfobacterales bacterium]